MARPIHKLQWYKKSPVAYTWCGVNPYRKGVQHEHSYPNAEKATCKACLAAEAKALASLPAHRKVTS